MQSRLSGFLEEGNGEEVLLILQPGEEKKIGPKRRST